METSGIVAAGQPCGQSIITLKEPFNCSSMAQVKGHLMATLMRLEEKLNAIIHVFISEPELLLFFCCKKGFKLLLSAVN